MQAAKRMASNVYQAPALTFELLAKCSVCTNQPSGVALPMDLYQMLGTNY